MPYPALKPRTRKPGEDRKTDIMRAALDLSFRRGPDQVTTGMIARELGLSQPALYKHFPKKADIWRAISDSLCARVADNIVRAKAREGSNLDRLRHLVSLQLELVRDVPALPDIMTMRNPDAEKSRLQTQMQASMGNLGLALTEITREAIDTGELRQNLDPADVATLIIGIGQSLALRMLVFRNPDIVVPNGKRLLDLLLSGFTEKGER
ncbi:MAG: TetR/AcrR family transcriptional regulator [Alphaproteobacteria bacterium]|nr:TetR/AcrR family transcriptional regulator [Alphaproteobacteria bacterium]